MNTINTTLPGGEGSARPFFHLSVAGLMGRSVDLYCFVTFNIYHQDMSLPYLQGPFFICQRLVRCVDVSICTVLSVNVYHQDMSLPLSKTCLLSSSF
jgi:hypothetical protein